MPLFGRKTKYTEDVRQAKKDEADAGRHISDIVRPHDDTPEFASTGIESNVNDTHSTSQPAGAAGGVHTCALCGGDPTETGNFIAPQRNANGALGGPPAMDKTQGLTPSSGAPETLGSAAALREQGLRLEREAEVLHTQSKEIAEAERLEQEAREHRERASASA